MASNGRKVAERQEMVETYHPQLSILQQCILLSISRSGYYYVGKNSITEQKQLLLDTIDKLYTDAPYLGTRKMVEELKLFGFSVGRKQVRSYYNILNINAIYPNKRMTIATPEHKKYPYLLRNLTICRVNQVWSSDITYIKMEHGFLYLCVVVDWYSRRILSWGISNTHDAELTTGVLRRALAEFGTPEIFNTDQGSEFTANEFTSILESASIRISMDGKGRALDNIFVERFWRTIKYEYVYIAHPTTGEELYRGVDEYITRYNCRRLHQSLAYRTPDSVYRESA